MGSNIENLERELADVKRRAVDDILAKNEEIQSLRRELGATRRAKTENDERFQLAAQEARQEAEHLRRELENTRLEISLENVRAQRVVENIRSEISKER